MPAVHPVRTQGWYAWESREELGKADRRLVLVPCGSVEQHGPHLPVGTDAWLAEAVAERVAQTRPHVLLAEPLAYGCSSHHKGFPGTVSLQPGTFMALISDVAVSLAGNGFVPIFVNGHGGNRAALTVAAQELLNRGVQVWVVTYFELIEEDLALLLPGYPDAVGHACALETSMVLHLWPEAVHRERVPGPGGRGTWPDPFLYPKDRVTHPRLFRDLDPNGVIGDPGLATAELGHRLFEAAVKRLGGVVDRIAAETEVVHG
jgi:creatinine amidohydrolase